MSEDRPPCLCTHPSHKELCVELLKEFKSTENIHRNTLVSYLIKRYDGKMNPHCAYRAADSFLSDDYEE